MRATSTWRTNAEDRAMGRVIPKIARGPTRVSYSQLVSIRCKPASKNSLIDTPWGYSVWNQTQRHRDAARQRHPRSCMSQSMSDSYKDGGQHLTSFRNPRWPSSDRTFASVSVASGLRWSLQQTSWPSPKVAILFARNEQGSHSWLRALLLRGELSIVREVGF